MWRPLPLATSGAGTDALLANDVSSASTVGTPAIGQVHAILANDVASASTVSAPAISQVHALLANDVASASTVSTPALAHIHVLAANDVGSASSVSAPAIAQVHALLANDVLSASSVGVPAVGQVHILAANDVGSASTVSNPALAEVSAGTDALLANDVVSASSVSVPSLGLVIVGGTDRGGDGFSSPVRQRRKFRKATRDQLEKLLFSKEEEPPRPTPKRVRAVQRDIVEQVAGGLLSPQKQEIARVVKREIVQAYQPSMDWNALIAAYEHVMRVAEEARIEQEIEDDDEEFLLMYA